MKIKDILYNENFDLNCDFIIESCDNDVCIIDVFDSSWDNEIPEELLEMEVSYITTTLVGACPVLIIQYNI